MLADLATKQENLKNTLLRISGAIQALEELKAEARAQSSEEMTTLENNRVVSPELIEPSQ